MVATPTAPGFPRDGKRGPITLKEMLEELAAAEHTSAPRVSLAILGNVTTEFLAPYLRHAALGVGVSLILSAGGYDTLAQEALVERSALISDAKIVFVLFNGRTAAPDLFDSYAALNPAQIEEACRSLRDRVAAFAEGIRRQTSAVIVWTAFETPVEPAFGVTDASMAHGQVCCIASLNDAIREVMQRIGNAYVLDMDRLVATVGAPAFYDERMWAMARSPYAAAGMHAVAGAVARFVRALGGRVRKCLVLDCDDVLWGGVLGEEGLSRIKLSRAHPGEAYRNIQLAALDLFSRGVAIALCSKNNESDVWEVFDQHPEMVLKRQHIAAHRINWEDKATNLVQIARELNIGLDALVFVDDNPFEIEMIRATLPEVETMLVPHDRVTGAAQALRQRGLFDSLAVTAEDRERGKMFLEAAQRRELESVATNRDGYLAGLNITVAVESAKPVHYARMAQLSQKTNQFNLTTRRYGEGDIKSFAESPDRAALCCTVSDRFGSLGLVGICLLRIEGGDAEIDTLLMSCRALGRGAEQALMHAVRDAARQRGAGRIVGHWIPTPKNALSKDYLSSLGFSAVMSDGANESYVLEEGMDLAPLPGYLTTSFKH